MTKVGSCDLSEVFTGTLEVTIDGLGTFKTQALRGASLGGLVAEVQCVLLGEAVIVQNLRKSPWQVVSFDREKGHLTVKLAS